MRILVKNIKKKTMKKLVLLISTVLFFSISNEVSAQKFVIGYGLSIYTDIATITPEGENSESDIGFSLLTASAEMKYNLYELNSDMAISLASSPAFGLMNFDGEGIGNFRLPLYAQFDFGNLSTFDSTKDFGIGLGIGYVFEGYNIFGDQESFSGGGLGARLGFRYFNRNNSAREIALKATFPRDMDIETRITNPVTGDSEIVTTGIPVASYQLSWILYFNY